MKKVLVVEDDALMIDLFRSWFSRNIMPSSGTLVQFVSKGTEADISLSCSSFDVTFLDMALPGVSGDTLLKNHRSNMGYVVMVSVYAEYLGKKFAVDETIVKPITEDQFVERMNTIFDGGCYVDERTSGARKVY